MPQIIPLRRTKAGIIELIVAIIVGTIVCLGYNKLYFEVKLPNGSIAQILDIMDYISNNIMMPIVAIGTCILIGWISKPQTVIEEVQKNGEKFSRKGMYVVGEIHNTDPVVYPVLKVDRFIDIYLKL